VAKRSSAKRKQRPTFWGRILSWLSSPAKARRRLFVRNVMISSEVLDYVRGKRCNQSDRIAFAELMLVLDANPLQSEALLSPRPGLPYPRGLRWARFGDHKVVFQFDPSHDSIRLVVCEGPD
jgi:hypothetical protein